MTARQLPLDFGHNPNYATDDYLVAPCNADAHDWIMRWPGWGGRMLALVGPAGSGKSHLAHVFSARSNGDIIAADSLSLDDPPLLAAKTSIVVEDADQGVDEQALFHLYNLVNQGSGALLLTGREPPARWAVQLPDLRSRLATIPLAMIGPPDDILLEALLVKLFADRQLRISDDVPIYLAMRMERSFASARALAAAIDKASLAGRRPINTALARSVLANVAAEKE